MEMVCAIVYQLTKDLSPEEIERSGFAPYYVDHTLALWPQAASGAPWTATYFQSKGDPITDLHEDLAAEQKARTTYDNILRLVKDPEVCDPIRFLRQREIVHYQRFGESLRIVQEKLDSKNFYAVNPEFDKYSLQHKLPLPFQSFLSPGGEIIFHLYIFRKRISLSHLLQRHFYSLLFILSVCLRNLDF